MAQRATSLGPKPSLFLFCLFCLFFCFLFSVCFLGGFEGQRAMNPLIFFLFFLFLLFSFAFLSLFLIEKPCFSPLKMAFLLSLEAKLPFLWKLRQVA